MVSTTDQVSWSGTSQDFRLEDQRYRILSYHRFPERDVRKTFNAQFIHVITLDIGTQFRQIINPRISPSRTTYPNSKSLPRVLHQLPSLGSDCRRRRGSRQKDCGWS